MDQISKGSLLPGITWLPDKQGNTAAAHHLMAKKGAVSHDWKKLPSPTSLLYRESAQLCPLRAKRSFCWCICRYVPWDRLNEHISGTDGSPRCLLGPVKLIITFIIRFGISQDQRGQEEYSAWRGSFAKCIASPKTCRLVKRDSWGLGAVDDVKDSLTVRMFHYVT